SLALAQRCSGVAAPTPLFSALLNYRHGEGSVPSASVEEKKHAWEGIEWLYNEERTNYPLTLSVDDFGRGFLLTALVQRRVGAQRICGFMETALAGLADALEREPERAVRKVEVLPEEERRRVLYEWNETKAEYPGQKCVHELFEEQVEAAPEAVAVVQQERE